MPRSRLTVRTNLLERATRAVAQPQREQQRPLVDRGREGSVIRRNPRLSEAEIRAKRVEAMANGPVRIFFARLLMLDVAEPIQFEYENKLVTITIEDLPDGD